MNAQVALALDSTGALAPKFPGINVPHVQSFELVSDPVLQALWVSRLASASASVTLQQLRDTRSIDLHLANEGDGAPRFKILCSDQPGVFSLGGDLQFFLSCLERGDRQALASYARLAIQGVWSNVSAHAPARITAIALVQGEAQGGGFEAALACNTLVAERGSNFGFPESLFGMFPGMGGELLLSARVGHDVARRIANGANRYSAEFLHEIGVVDYLVETGAGAEFVTSLLVEAQDKRSDDETGFGRRARRFDGISFDLLANTVERWLEQVWTLDARQLRTMRYIVEMQTRRVA